jgi:hypothetical protein
MDFYKMNFNWCICKLLVILSVPLKKLKLVTETFSSIWLSFSSHPSLNPILFSKLSILKISLATNLLGSSFWMNTTIFESLTSSSLDNCFCVNLNSRLLKLVLSLFSPFTSMNSDIFTISLSLSIFDISVSYKFKRQSTTFELITED